MNTGFENYGTCTPKWRGFSSNTRSLGRLRYKRSAIQLSEEFLGSYKAEKLTFLIGSQRIVAKPIGRMLIGAQGRVGLVGIEGNAADRIARSRWTSL